MTAEQLFSREVSGGLVSYSVPCDSYFNYSILLFEYDTEYGPVIQKCINALVGCPRDLEGWGDIHDDAPAALQDAV